MTTGKFHGWIGNLFVGVRRLVVWVRSIREFNIALLGKWCWWLLAERETLWFKVLSARYGVEGGRLLSGGRESSLWWRDIHDLCREEWFSDHVSRSVGDGKTTCFWTDVWLGRVSFSVRYSRLYDLTVLKGELVFQLSQLGWGENGGAWSWRRRLFAWEEELVRELILLLGNVTLQVNKVDRWLWNLENSKSFTVRSAYNYLTAQIPTDTLVPVASLWHKDIPLKVVLFAWHLFRDRLPTKDNLFRRGVIDQNSLECAAVCGSVESSAHLFAMFLALSGILFITGWV
jgi:hypothetical protein